MNGHAEDCICIPCCMADMDRHLREQGIDPGKYDDFWYPKDTSVRTRYKIPGQKSGRGVVHRATPKMIWLIKRLLTTRNTANLTRLPGSEDVDNISFAGGKHLIEQLLGCPELENVAAEVPTASEKQLNWLIRCGTDKDLTGASAETIAAIEKANAGEPVSNIEAHAALDWLFNVAKWKPRERKQQTIQLTPGIYLLNGDIYKVQKARAPSTNLYAKRLNQDTGEFEYAPGMVNKLSPENTMTKAQALNFAQQFCANVELSGICFCCGRELTDETSMERKIGPICWDKYF